MFKEKRISSKARFWDELDNYLHAGADTIKNGLMRIVQDQRIQIC